ncbi:MAG TPA: serine hydrolase domain-containing protein, partial [Pyrinomonadaceae bacterium]|nr:serine hydrolase domain-containing protein [Pyrinomonadaceae bacterium]
IIYSKGLGYKDYESKVAVTPDTQFAIGSATKAFTALSVLMAADEGKLSLEDSPKKYLSYFKMYDPDTDKNITIRDLMCHSSGLNRTDLAMVTGKLTRAELIQVAAQAKPTAKLREKFQYQSIMFTAAGEIASVVEKTPYDKLIIDRVFKPLGMANSTVSMKQMQKAKDYSFGYNYNFDTKDTARLPFRDIDEIAPAGSINSSANDMAQWLRFVLNGGSVNGKRLVSEKNYEEWLKPQMKIAGTSSYGFGWFLQDWNGLKVVQHGGNIDGFNSMVAMIPEKHIGFVLLTNVSASSLGGDLMPIVWENLLSDKKVDENIQLPFRTMERLIGKYHLDEANINIEVKIDGDKLVMIFPGQHQYTLKRTAPRQFVPIGAQDGFGVKFTPETGDATQLILTQPDEPKATFNRVNADGTIAKPAETQTAVSTSAKDLIGKYATPAGVTAVEIRESDGKITFNVGGQQPYTLADTGEGKFSMSPLPSTYWLTPKRGADGKISAVAVTQPEGVFEFKRVTAESAPKMAIDELMQKAIEAAGGEANIRKVTTRVMEFDMDLESQGVQAHGTSYAKAPNRSAGETTFTALGKTIGTEWEFFDGTKGEDALSFAPTDKYSGKRLEDIRIGSDLYAMLNWKTAFKKVEVIGTAKINGEDAWIVSFESEKGTPYREYYSTKTFLALRRDGLIASSTSDQQIPYQVTFTDYRDVDGLKLPFKTINNNIANGNIVTTVKSIKHNVPIDDSVFGPKKVK